MEPTPNVGQGPTQDEWSNLYHLQDCRDFKAYRQMLKELALRKLGGRCVRCGQRDVRALQFDHINGLVLGEARVSILRCCHEVLEGSTKYQLLCASCNWIKRAEEGEVRGYRAVRAALADERDVVERGQQEVERRRTQEQVRERFKVYTEDFEGLDVGRESDWT